MQKLLYEMGNCFLIQWPGKRDDAIAFRDYVLSLETEHREMRKLIKYVDIMATEDDADEDKQCLAIIKTQSQQLLSSLTIR